MFLTYLKVNFLLIASVWTHFPVASTGECPSDWRLHGGLCYRLTDEPLDFRGAEAKCGETPGAVLALPRDNGQHGVMVQLARDGVANQSGYICLWIAANPTIYITDGDRRPIDWESWEGDIPITQPRCLFFQHRKSVNYWKTANCHLKLYSVCQLEAVSTAQQPRPEQQPRAVIGCQMNDVIDSKPLGKAYRKFTANFFQDCISECFEDVECYLTQHVNGRCYLYTCTAAAHSPGSTISAKICSEDGVTSLGLPMQCHMTAVDGQAELDNYSSAPSPGLQDCLTRCAADIRCLGSEWSAATCLLYSSHRTEPQPGAVFYRKTCQEQRCKFYHMTDAPDTSGQVERAYRRTEGNSAEDCKLACGRDQLCMATEWAGRQCFLYPEVNVATPSPGAVLSLKQCATQAARVDVTRRAEFVMAEAFEAGLEF